MLLTTTSCPKNGTTVSKRQCDPVQKNHHGFGTLRRRPCDPWGKCPLINLSKNLSLPSKQILYRHNPRDRILFFDLSPSCSPNGLPVQDSQAGLLHNHTGPAERIELNAQGVTR